MKSLPEQLCIINFQMAVLTPPLAQKFNPFVILLGHKVSFAFATFYDGVRLKQETAKRRLCNKYHFYRTFPF